MQQQLFLTLFIADCEEIKKIFSLDSIPAW